MNNAFSRFLCLIAVLATAQFQVASAQGATQTYRFQLGNVKVDNPRSPRSDTNTFSIAAVLLDSSGNPVGPPATDTWKPGFDMQKNGNYPMGSHHADVQASSGQSIKVTLSAINAGSNIGGALGTFTNFVAQVDQQAATIYFDSPEMGQLANISDHTASSILPIGWFGGCGGVVILATVTFKADDLSSKTYLHPTWWHQTQAGSDSPSGCGSNSSYTFDMRAYNQTLTEAQSGH